MHVSLRGQTLVEVLVALGAVAVVIASITVAVLTALNNAEFSRNQSTASQYAQAGLEIIRSMRYTDYPAFAALTFPNYCMAAGCTALNNTVGDQCGQQAVCQQNAGIFVRSVSFSSSAVECDGSATRVGVRVAWTDGNCTDRDNLFCHAVTLHTCISDFGVID
jgi:type II secretory pathway pseudopilin PulG